MFYYTLEVHILVIHNKELGIYQELEDFSRMKKVEEGDDIIYTTNISPDCRLIY